MSSLLKEEMQKLLFRPQGERLEEMIEIEEPRQGRHFLCVSVSKSKGVQISVVACSKHESAAGKKLRRVGLQDSYLRTEVWTLQNLQLLDGIDPDADDPCFLMHFDSVRRVQAVSSAAKYSLARTLVTLHDARGQDSLNLRNYDWRYIHPTSIYSNRGDCMVLMQICFYAFNLVCLSMCPVPL